MKTSAKNCWDKFSKWIDRNLGYFLTNPSNHKRLKRRYDLEDSLKDMK